MTGIIRYSLLVFAFAAYSAANAVYAANIRLNYAHKFQDGIEYAWLPGAYDLIEESYTDEHPFVVEYGELPKGRCVKWALYRDYPYGSNIVINANSASISYSRLNAIAGRKTMSPPLPTEGAQLVPNVNWMNFKLSYSANGGVAHSLPKTVTLVYTNKVKTAASTVCTWTGHSFAGWNTKANGTGVSLKASTSYAKSGGTLGVSKNDQNVVLYAQWSVDKYKLSLRTGDGIAKIYYKVNGASSYSSTTSNLTVKVDYDSVWYAYAEPKAGYDYNGPTASSPESNRMKSADAAFEPITTPKKIKVTYYGNGSTAGSPYSEEFTFGYYASLLANRYSREYLVEFDPNYQGAIITSTTAASTFQGWNDRSDGTGSYNYANAERVRNPCGSTGAAVSLYAKWKLGTITLPEVTRPDYLLAGWYTDPACVSGFIGAGGASYTPSEAVRLYAKWNLDVGPLSRAVGLDNAVLKASGIATDGSLDAISWHVMTNMDLEASGVAIGIMNAKDPVASGTSTLSAKVIGRGRISFSWRYEIPNAEKNKALVYFMEQSASWPKLTALNTWIHEDLEIQSGGETELKWIAQLTSLPKDTGVTHYRIFVKDIRWTPCADNWSYGIAFNASGSETNYVKFALGEVFNLPPCPFVNGEKKFLGWKCEENDRRYDDGMMIFNLAPSNTVLNFTSIWSD